MTQPLRTELDPEVVAVIEEIEAAGVPEWSAMSVESARHVEDEVFSGGDPPKVDFVRDLAIPGPGDSSENDVDGEIPIRVYRHGGVAEDDSTTTDDSATTTGTDAGSADSATATDTTPDVDSAESATATDTTTDTDSAESATATNIATTAGTNDSATATDTKTDESATGKSATEKPTTDKSTTDESATDESGRPVLVYYHGGGWVLGTLDSIDGVCRRLARRGECVVVSVDYRLAPENPFPAAVDDAVAALRWVADHAEAFGGDPDRLAVGGTSAGGNLSAVTALRSREDESVPEIARQFLFYPITDYAFDTDSYAENGDGPLLTEADMRWFWDRYLRSEVDGANPYASPLRARDLAGLPPATVVTCGFDPLRDEGVAYAERLESAGVEVRHDHHPDQPHGFLSTSESVSAADEALDDIGSELQSL